MTEFKKYRNKESGDIVEAKFLLSCQGWLIVYQGSVRDFISNEDLNQKYEPMTNPI